MLFYEYMHAWRMGSLSCSYFGLVCGKQDKISCKLYHCMYKMHTRLFTFPNGLTVYRAHQIFFVLSEYWIHQNVPKIIV